MTGSVPLTTETFQPDLAETGAVEEQRPPELKSEPAGRATFRVWRGDRQGGNLVDYSTSISPGMVVLDAIHQIQAEQANDLAVRWNCKAGKCGSCSAEVNGSPKLMCMTRLSELPLDKPVTVEPMRAFPPIKDLAPDAPDGTWRMAQSDVDRVQEFRKCIECFLCQDVCHVLRDHHLHQEFIGPRLLVHVAALEMHPLDVEDRVEDLRQGHGIGYCNITKCCTKVCPEHITITDNAIIPLKERVVDEFFDPLGKLVKIFSRRGESKRERDKNKRER
jgi:succinate dehydrogenase / fumarate reductase, iron-sulfur subunit